MNIHILKNNSYQMNDNWIYLFLLPLSLALMAVFPINLFAESNPTFFLQPMQGPVGFLIFAAFLAGGGGLQASVFLLNWREIELFRMSYGLLCAAFLVIVFFTIIWSAFSGIEYLILANAYFLANWPYLLDQFFMTMIEKF